MECISLSLSPKSKGRGVEKHTNNCVSSLEEKKIRCFTDYTAIMLAANEWMCPASDTQCRQHIYVSKGALPELCWSGFCSTYNAQMIDMCFSKSWLQETQVQTQTHSDHILRLQTKIYANSRMEVQPSCPAHPWITGSELGWYESPVWGSGSAR